MRNRPDGIGPVVVGLALLATAGPVDAQSSPSRYPTAVAPGYFGRPLNNSSSGSNYPTAVTPGYFGRSREMRPAPHVDPLASIRSRVYPNMNTVQIKPTPSRRGGGGGGGGGHGGHHQPPRPH